MLFSGNMSRKSWARVFGLLRDMLLLKSMYFRFFSLYNIGIPLFLENKSYPGIPTPCSCMRCYHTNNHNRVRSETQASRVVTSGVKTGLDLIAPPHYDPPFLENKSYPGIATYLVPSTGDHSML